MRGFSLIELAVVLAVVGVLVTLGVPSFTAWLANARVRAVADSLANDLRRAQSAAVERNRQVAFILTNSTPAASSIAATTSARNWSVRSLPLLNSDEGTDNASGSTTFLFANAQTSTSDTTVEGDSSALCFNSLGRLVASNTTIADAGGVTCTAPTTNVPRYFRVQNTIGDRPLWIQAFLGGQLRMCDPNKTLPNQPDGCCTSQCCGLTATTYCVY